MPNPRPSRADNPDPAPSDGGLTSPTAVIAADIDRAAAMGSRIARGGGGGLISYTLRPGCRFPTKRRSITVRARTGRDFPAKRSSVLRMEAHGGRQVRRFPILWYAQAWQEFGDSTFRTEATTARTPGSRPGASIRG